MAYLNEAANALVQNTVGENLLADRNTVGGPGLNGFTTLGQAVLPLEDSPRRAVPHSVCLTL